MSSNPFRLGLIRCRRSTVAIFTALLAPVLAGAVALGVEVTSWSGAQLDLQRTADASAMAGMLYCYKVVSNSSNCGNSPAVAQTAATMAAQMAEINGASGGSSPSWNSATETYTDNQITAQIVHGLRQASDTALLVTALKTVPLTISRIISSQSSVTVSASSTGELVSSTSGGGGGQPCVVALSGDSTTDPITAGTDLGISGSIDINAPTCTVVSDQGITLSGIASITAAGVYSAGNVTLSGSATVTTTGGLDTGGSVSMSGSATVTGPESKGAGQISDPYASDTTLQNALATANSATGSAITCSGSGSCSGPSGWGSCSGATCTVNPGTYTGLSVSGSTGITLKPGLYTIDGNISFSGSTTVSGSGVTILMGTGHTFSTSGSTVVTLTAPTTAGASGGAIPGIAFASQATGSLSLSGSAGIAFAGVIYYPNGATTISGSSASGSTTCAELITYALTLSGSANFASSCASYGTLTFGSLASTTTYTAELVR